MGIALSAWVWRHLKEGGKRSVPLESLDLCVFETGPVFSISNTTPTLHDIKIMFENEMHAFVQTYVQNNT